MQKISFPLTTRSQWLLPGIRDQAPAAPSAGLRTLLFGQRAPTADTFARQSASRVSTATSGRPHEERYWNVEVPKLGGGKREVWRGESRVEDEPRVGHPGRLMGALQGLLGRRSR